MAGPAVASGSGVDAELQAILAAMITDIEEDGTLDSTLIQGEILAASCRLLAERCVDGLEAHRARASEMVERSLAMVTALAPRIGYDLAADIAKEAYASGRTIREIALERDVVPSDELDEILDPRSQTEGASEH